jgi:hypothetical protein
VLGKNGVLFFSRFHASGIALCNAFSQGTLCLSLGNAAEEFVTIFPLGLALAAGHVLGPPDGETKFLFDDRARTPLTLVFGFLVLSQNEVLLFFDWPRLF